MAVLADALGPGARHAKLEEFALQAFVGLVVHLIGVGVLIAFYYNLCVLDTYILALFWAVIFSIPVFQIKMKVIHSMQELLDWWWSLEYLVLSASDGGALRLQPLGCGVEGPEAAGTGAEEVREDLELPSEVMLATELRRRLESGEQLHAVVQCRQPPGKDRVVRIVTRVHWLGTFRPYESFSDFNARDLPGLWYLGAQQVEWMVKPLRRFRRGEASSQPYFELVVRLCLLHWSTRFFLPAFLVPGLFLAAHIYFFVVIMRLVVTLLAHLAPHVVYAAEQGLERMPPEYRDWCTSCLRQLKVTSRWCFWVVRRRSSGVVHTWLTTFLENSHFILSILIILVCILVACKALSLLCLSLRREAFVILRTFHGLLQPSPVYQVAMAKVSHLVQVAGAAHAKVAEEGSAASLWNLGQSLIETTVPEYQEWLQHNVPDFHILKYILYDIWRADDGLGERWLQQNSSLEALASLAGGLGAAGGTVGGFGGTQTAGASATNAADVEDDDDACSDAVAVGATCVQAEVPLASRGKPLQEQLQNTTALLRLMVRGNISAAFHLLHDAYREVAAASSLLDIGNENRSSITMLGGALHGSSWLARLTMHGTIVLVHVLTIASSMLGQAIVFLTALFYLLASRVSCLEVLGEFLMVIDRSKVIFRIGELVVRAVLFSALKMSAFHALFTWLLYSWGRIPVVVVPTVLSALVALVPVVSPVWSVSIWAAVYLWVQGEVASAALALFLNLGVWWQVPTVIYAEIPESNPWLTGLSVVLGIGQFGVAGVVLGPMIASVPLICFNLVKLFNEKRFAAPTSLPVPMTPPRRHTLLTLYQSESFLSQGPENGALPGPSTGTPAAGRRRRPVTRSRGAAVERSLGASGRHAAEDAVEALGSTAAAGGDEAVDSGHQAEQVEEKSKERESEEDESEEEEDEDDDEDEEDKEDEEDEEESKEVEKEEGAEQQAQREEGNKFGSGGHGWSTGSGARVVSRSDEASEPEEARDQDSIPLSSLIEQMKHREISERVLNSPGGLQLKQLRIWDQPSPPPQQRNLHCAPQGHFAKSLAAPPAAASAELQKSAPAS